MTKSVIPDGKLHKSQWLSPTILIRVGSILMVGLMIGHTSAYPWTSTHIPQETQLADSMKSVDFVFMGEHSTYWNLYFGWGLWMAVSLLTLAIILWLLSDIAHLAPRNVGLISGIISGVSLVGAYLSLRFFYIPPFIFYAVICVILLTAAVQLLRQQTKFTDGKQEKL